MTEDVKRFGDPRIPAETIASASHLFHLSALPPTRYDGGSQQQAHEDNFPILQGQAASIQLITLQPGAIREPHWHPSAWELNLILKGSANWVLIDGNGNHEAFEAHVDDLVFAPQGSLHYFENLGTEDLEVLIVQNASASEDKDNVGIGESVSQMPPDVLGAVFGVPAATFEKFTKHDSAVTILRAR
ncbi:cupin domain-containing protein [Mycobacterium paraterrae]|uniref:Cupin domain-containing protein n=1 Tax=Mycobacterium paraterrae TaxID=577492 RepID=A0ABY3VEN9_9MYCO|nr:cupin domain-containing protein [Mycobacterium paraterrae]UMB67902.1 cupin domain-containing protein [Mycobacterium paraterrae]